MTGRGHGLAPVAVGLLVGLVVLTGVYAAAAGPRSAGPALPLPVVAASEPPAPPAPVAGDGVEEASRVVAPAPQPDPAWVAAVATATGIGPVAVGAYAAASLAVAASDPGCRLGWTTLAGIGAVESGHGTHGGARLDPDGRPDLPIVGPALDGSPGVAAIRASADGTAWHGDPVWEHAVGPLQFLPSTWRQWGADGDADGVQDPRDLDDAALAAGHYLCAGGGDLSTGTGWAAAVRSYNHDDSYVATVLATADRYAAAAAAAP
ncbi:lytic transglycosylase domain-containing protein [Cellulomonas sp. ICMP 17802]|uniref:lytic transglycosylase domain-containing protein n=1 Tax=Cellulomonas sp. ICMP 17802 TaxID=3239199 RepID=UPI00351BE22A